MATLENIRKRGALIAVVIGFALFAFILGDLVNSGGNLFSGDQKEMAVIDGESVSIDEFQLIYKQWEEVYKIQTRKTSIDQETQKQLQEQVWEEILRKYIFSSRYENSGIDVSSLELAEMVRGQNIDADPSIRQLFTDQQTGQYNSAAAIQFFSNIDQTPEYKVFGLYLENQMRENKKYAKYASLISKGINVTSFDAGALYKERVQLVDFKYIGKKYNTIVDSTIVVSDKEISDYYNEHKDEYEQEHTRDIAYVSFKIVPSQKDFDDAKAELEDYKADFSAINIDSTTSDIINYVIANSQTTFINKHLTQEEVKDSSFFFAELGTVKGPILENGFYKIKRLIGRQEMPDSVEARHILIQPDGQKILDMAAATIIADSIKGLLENGDDFATLAIQHSADKGSATKGGDLGKFVEGSMVQAFNDACFNGKTNDLVIVESQYGIHIIEITWQSEYKTKVLIAILDKEVLPQKETMAAFFTKARNFSAASKNSIEGFDAEIEKAKLTKRVALDLTPSTEVIAGVENARQIITWAFKSETEQENVSEAFQSGNNFVVAIVSQIKEEGIAPLDQIRDAIIAKVRLEKKGTILSKELKAAIASNKNFKDAATKIKALNSIAKNINFSASRINNLGSEPAILGTAFSLAKDQISEPIIGLAGVYVIKVTSFTGVDDLSNVDLTNDKTNAQNRLQFRSNREIYNSVKNSVEVEDLRHKFF